MLNKSRAFADKLHLFAVMIMSSYENYIVNILKAEKVHFYREKTFKDLKGGSYRFDFYIPNF